MYIPLSEFDESIMTTSSALLLYLLNSKFSTRKS